MWERPGLNERIDALRARLWLLQEALEDEADLTVCGEIADRMLRCADRICELRRRVVADCVEDADEAA